MWYGGCLLALAAVVMFLILGRSPRLRAAAPAPAESAS
jgi:hypothetical protein